MAQVAQTSRHGAALELSLTVSALPPSFRFLGCKVHLAATQVLIAIMREGATAGRMRRRSGLVVDGRTVERWRKWWRDNFTTSPSWREAAAAFMPPVDQDACRPRLIERFAARQCEIGE
jgi:hypothetical protein